VPVADFYPADGFSPASGGFAFGELLFIAIKSNQKALARLSSTALALNSFSWSEG
jgi:hypothetical protein